MRWWDLEQVLPLERELFGREAWPAEAFWSELAGWPMSRHYLVACAGEQVVGYAGLLATRRAAADIQTVAVAPAAQGRGLGGRLVDALLAEAAGRECPAVLLEVRADNEVAQRLYRRHGFDQIGVRRGYYAAGTVDALVLRRRLSGRIGP